MKYAALILPLFVAGVFIVGIIKKIDLYDAFVCGIRQALSLIVSIFPYLTAVFVMTELLKQSGISDLIISACSPVFQFLGIPKEVCPLVLMKPFSGSGSLALLSEVFKEYGADSYVARCASCIFGSSETVFYVSAVYYSKCKNKKLLTPVLISLFATFCSAVFACFICKII